MISVAMPFQSHSYLVTVDGISVFYKFLHMQNYIAGYNVVVKIPAGATNIEILQHSYSGRPEDDNYLGKQM